MVEPTGYTALDLIGFTDKGPYDPTANYVKNDLVHVGNSTWRCKIDDTTGITPTEGANWTIFIESATSLAGMSDVDLNTPKAGDGLVHDGNDWTNIPIMTKEQWKKNGAYNLYNHNLQTQVVNTGGGSVTVTVNRTVGSPDYGTFSIVGTVGSATDIVVGALDSNVFKAGQKYKLTGCPSGGGASTYNIRITGAGVEDHGDGVEFTATGSDQMKIQLRGASINATFKPMITTDINATYDDYAPYAKTNRELTDLKTDNALLWTDPSNISSISSFASINDGFWSIGSADVARMTDKPTGMSDTKVYIICRNDGSSSLFNILISPKDNHVYVRFKYTSSWSDWVTIA